MSILSGKYRIKQKYLYLLERQWYREKCQSEKLKSGFLFVVWVRVKIYFVDEWPDFNFDVDIVFRHI